MKILPLTMATASTLITVQSTFSASTSFLTSLDGTPTELAQIPPATRSVQVQFAKGKSAATVSGQVKGYETVDYILNARAGQKMTVNVSSNSTFLTPVIIGPQDKPVCPEPCEIPWNGTLPVNGNYHIRVGLVRAEARRNGTANYTVTVGITN